MRNRVRCRRRALKATCLCAAVVLVTGLSQVAASDTEAHAQGPYAFQTFVQAEGFDTCANPDPTALEDWWSGTPWWVYGFYLGGANGSYTGCVTSASYAQYAISIGYAVMPIWYGYQMPTSCGNAYFPVQISLNTSTAFSEGVVAANNAAAAAEADGFSAYNVIYYDLEGDGWDTGSATCVDAAEAFVDGWDYQLDVNTPFAGALYGSTCSSDLNAYAGIQYVPTNVWASDTNGNPEIFNLLCLSNGYWVDNQRIHQYSAEDYLSYNGYPMYVDEDCVDGTVDLYGDVTDNETITVDNC
jgi:hypothetical protein